jgi:hypothetical protein
MAKRTIKSVVTQVVEVPKTTWQKIKDWFYNSETIALNWIMGVFGVITSAVGYFDFAPLWTMFQTGTQFTKPQLIGIGIGIAGAGLTGYLARVRGTKAVAGQLLPKNA